MRLLLLSVCFLCCAQLYAQPQGLLYVQQYAGDSLGVIEFPSGNYTYIDSTTASELVVQGDYLYVATGYKYALGGDVLVYDRHTLQLVDSIVGAEAFAIDFWGDKLVVSAIEIVPPQSGSGMRILGEQVRSDGSEELKEANAGDLVARVKELATKVFESLGIRDFGRVDVKTDERDQCYIPRLKNVRRVT